MEYYLSRVFNKVLFVSHLCSICIVSVFLTDLAEKASVTKATVQTLIQGSDVFPCLRNLGFGGIRIAEDRDKEEAE